VSHQPYPKRHHLLLLVAVLLSAVPVLFGLVRAINTGEDFRYLWLAAAAIVGSLAVMGAWHRVPGPERVSLGVRWAPSPPEPAVPLRRLSSWGRLWARELQ